MRLWIEARATGDAGIAYLAVACGVHFRYVAVARWRASDGLPASSGTKVMQRTMPDREGDWWIQFSNLTADEWAWVLEWFRGHAKRLPKCPWNTLFYNASRLSPEKLHTMVRAEAVHSRHAVWRAVQLRALLGRWPKQHEQTAFWLGERWQAACRVVDAELARSGGGKGSVGLRVPDDALVVIKAILLDYWDNIYVDHWIATHLREHVYFANDGRGDHARRSFAKWLAGFRRDVEMRRA